MFLGSFSFDFFLFFFFIEIILRKSIIEISNANSFTFHRNFDNLISFTIRKPRFYTQERTTLFVEGVHDCRFRYIFTKIEKGKLSPGFVIRYHLDRLARNGPYRQMTIMFVLRNITSRSKFKISRSRG